MSLECTAPFCVRVFALRLLCLECSDSKYPFLSLLSGASEVEASLPTSTKPDMAFGDQRWLGVGVELGPGQ